MRMTGRRGGIIICCICMILLAFIVQDNIRSNMDYTKIKASLTEMLSGNMDVSMASGDYLVKLNSLISDGRNSWDRLNKNENSTPFDYDMSTTAGITKNYNEILTMAIAYSIKGSDNYHSPELLADIVYALDYMHENYYRDKDLHEYPTRNNWWDWEIGSAQKICKVLLLIEESLSLEQMERYLKPVNCYVSCPAYTGANRVDTAYVCIVSACLLQDREKLATAVSMLEECYAYVDSGDGFYADGSFVQHTYIAYTGSYGSVLLNTLSEITLALSGTSVEINNKYLDIQFDWVMSAFTPVMYHGAFFSSVRGRSICRTNESDVSFGGGAISGMLMMTEYMKDEKKNELLKSILKDYYSYNSEFYREYLSPYLLYIYDEIISDPQIEPRQEDVFSKVYGMMDRAVAYREKFGVSCSLSSSRIAKYEAINGENGTGWYTGDGMLQIYMDVNDFDIDYWSNVNMYRLPGTTITTAPRINENNSSMNTLSQYDFVGGASLEDSMVVAMELEGSTEGMVEEFQSTLHAQKAWFVFDNEVVALGSDISCFDKFDTETVIENRRIQKSESFFADGFEIDGEAGCLSDVSNLYIENYGAINMLTPTDIYYNRTDTSFLELFINHGKNVNGDTYAYVISPASLDTQKLDVKLLSNTPEVMGVLDTSSGVRGYVFWCAGEFDGVKVEKPCVIIISDKQLAVADPTQKISSIDVWVDDIKYTLENLTNGSTMVLDLK